MLVAPSARTESKQGFPRFKVTEMEGTWHTAMKLPQKMRTHINCKDSSKNNEGKAYYYLVVFGGLTWYIIFGIHLILAYARGGHCVNKCIIAVSVLSVHRHTV